ncbi:hypothetical protein AB1100_004144 [Pseudomonas aeruginosa]
MRKIVAAAFTVSTLCGTQASYIVKIPLDNNIQYYKWSVTEAVFSEWTNNGSAYGCSNWSPSPTSITISELFIQTATDCSQDQVRTVQDMEVDEISGSTRSVGEPYTQYRTIGAISTRDAVGSLENWVSIEPEYSLWVNSGDLYGCSWSPLTSTVASGKTFTQNGTNCKQDQTRLRQDREQEMTTLQTRNNGDLITEIQTLTGLTSQRTATGTYTSSSTASCKFSEANPRYYWLEYPSGVTIKVWDSKVVGNNDGYGYARAVYQRTSSDGIKYYSLCRA